MIIFRNQYILIIFRVFALYLDNDRCVHNGKLYYEVLEFHLHKLEKLRKKSQKIFSKVCKEASKAVIT